jgi:SM-20-related protein
MKLAPDATQRTAPWFKTIEPATLASWLTQVECRLAAVPGDPQLATLRAQLLRGLGELDAARQAYASLPGNAAAERLVAILSGAPIARDDRTGAAPFVRLHGFLDRQQQQDLWNVVGPAEFHAATMSLPDGVRVDREYRIAHEMRNSHAIRSWFLPLVARSIDEHVLDRLGLPAFDIGDWELQVTRHDDGGMLRIHRDRGATNRLRALSYVYYFHREPKRYSGGDLLLFDEIDRKSPRRVAAFTRLAPIDNSLLLFSPDRLHCVTTVCAGPDPFDARWTINGWLLRKG